MRPPYLRRGPSGDGAAASDGGERGSWGSSAKCMPSFCEQGEGEGEEMEATRPQRRRRITREEASARERRRREVEIRGLHAY